jgi:uncharacterized membrane protein YkoI
MRKPSIAIAAGVAAIGAATGVAVAADSSSTPAPASRIDDGAALLPQAAITEQAAIEAALAAAPGTLNEIDLEHFRGTLVFNVDVGQRDVKVDAATGKVLTAPYDGDGAGDEDGE